MTRGGVDIVFAGIAQCQYDIEAVVGVLQGSAIDHLGKKNSLSHNYKSQTHIYMYIILYTSCKIVWNSDCLELILAASWYIRGRNFRLSSRTDPSYETMPKEDLSLVDH